MDVDRRSKEAPMDFQFTSRPSSGTKPVWAASADDPSAPRKRRFDDLDPASPALPTSSSASMFGENRNVPFIFQSPLPHSNRPYSWAPPPNFSPQRAFPQHPAPDPHSPPKTEQGGGEKENGRTMATGGLRRLFRFRQKARDVPHSRRNGNDLSEDDRVVRRTLTQNTSNHYTINMPSAPADTPHVLRGYLQFFFSLAIVLLFLYLVVQFILIVQRDVEHRTLEYSMDIVQEIRVCATQYKNNGCKTNQIPAMIHQCATWETCMSRDPTTVGRARIGAELIAEVVNGFVEPISWKTLVFSLPFLALFVSALYWSRRQPPSSPASYPVAPFHQHYLQPHPNLGAYQNGTTDGSPEDAPRRRRLESGQAIKVK